MNTFKKFAFVAALLFAGQAFAGTVTLTRIGEVKELPSCEGTVTVTTSFWLGIPALRVEGNSQCSNIEYRGDRYKSQDYVKVTLDDTRRETVRIYSNSGKHADTVVVDIRPSFKAQFSNGQSFSYLADCGGTVELNVSGGQVNLVFRNVDQCSNFDILSANGEKVNYPNQKLEGANQNRYGSFTLPRSLYDYGMNGVTVVVKSNSGKHSDTFRVYFYAY